MCDQGASRIFPSTCLSFLEMKMASLLCNALFTGRGCASRREEITRMRGEERDERLDDGHSITS